MKRYLLNVTAEPTALHDQPGFAVHVVPDTRPAATDPCAGRQVLKDFFSLPAPRLYAVTLDAPGKVSDPSELDRADLATIDAGAEIMAWLIHRAPKAADLEAADPEAMDQVAYWVGNSNGLTEIDGDKNYETVLQDDHTIVPAMDLLRASLNWAAPVPQRAGLVHLAFRADPVGTNELLLIFPWWENKNPTGIQVSDVNGDAITTVTDMDQAVLLTVNSATASAQFISTFVKPFVPMGTGDVQNGWVPAGRLGSGDIRNLRRIRAELSGTLDAFAPLEGFPITGTDTAANTKAANYAKWLQKQARKLLFDRIDLAATSKGRFRDSLRDVLAEVASEDDVKATLAPEEHWLAVCPLIDAVLSQTGLWVEDANSSEMLAGFKSLEATLAALNELAIALTDPDQLRAIVAAYMRIATNGWLSTLDASQNDGLFLSRVDAAFDAYFKGPGANLAAELHEDAADALMDHFRTILMTHLDTEPAEQRMRDALVAFDWMTKRVLGASPPVGLRPLKTCNFGGLQDHLTNAYTLAIDGILRTDFVPDREPQPLTIIATDELDPTNFEKITAQITGFGVVIGAHHPDRADHSLESTYAHFNAAELTIRNGASVPMAIEPITPAPNYGQVELSITYNGVPQIGRLVATADPDSTTRTALELPQPYCLDHVAYEEDWKGLMRLAYGFEYHALPYYIPNSGTLPAKLRRKGSLILPDIGESLPSDPKPDVYLRTTPVATVSVTNATTSPHPGIGYVPPDVTPIGPELLKTSNLRDRIVDPGLVLLGHPDGPVVEGEPALSWKPEFQNGAILTISAPRVSFDDFDRWVANPFLREHLADTGLTLDLVDHIEDARDIFEDVHDVLSAELANRLPDPAVRKLRVRMEVFESVWQPRSVVDLQHDVDVHPYLNLPEITGTKSGTYARLISAIDRSAQFPLTIKVVPGSGAPTLTIRDGVLSATLRPGDICALTVCPMVPRAHYDENSALRAIHAGFLGLEKTVENDLGDMICLRGTSLLLEAMDMPRVKQLAASPNDSVLGALKVLPEGRDRGYTLRLCPAFDDINGEQAIFRAFSEVELITQRWRSTGQPIPDWIEPAQYACPDSPVAVVPFDEISDDLGDVGKFESGAFFGRALYDGERRRIKLPAFLPGGTQADAVVLDRVTWPSPAATYLRYAQIYRSRYLGAMATNTGAIPAIGATTEARKAHPLTHRFTTRVAILADISGNTIVTPQVRHILPSLAGSRDEDAPLPFVLSLNERPFDQYGLADRILPQVTTIQTFILSNPDNTLTRLNFDQYRKEIGPEPRASLNPVADAPSRAVILRTEGPVGHHFDPPNADAPGFVNTSYLLHLEGLDPQWAHQQMFAAIELRRLVEPGWTFTPKPPNDRGDMPPAWTLDLTQLSGPLEIAHGDLRTSAIRIAPTDDGQVVEIDKKAAYGDANSPAAGFAELCTLTNEGATHRLIHRDLGKAGFEVLILRQQSAGTSPQIVASARYKADGPPAVLPHATNAVSPPLTPVLLSDAPGAQWALSAYDLGQVCFGSHTAPLSEAVATIRGTQLGFCTATGEARRLTSRDALADHPLSVHTYFAAVTLQRSANAGRRVLLPQETVMLDPVGRAQLSLDAPVEQAAIMAFAAPAEVIRSSNQSPASATFDLDAVTSNDQTQTLFFRCRISRLVLGASNSLTLSLSAPGDANPPARVTLSALELVGLQFIEIRIGTEGHLDSVLLYTTDEGGGSATVSIDRATGQISLDHGAITLAVSGPDQVDMDVSMIPAVPPDSSAWNWDWVFPPIATGGAETGGPAPMDSALRPAAMTHQREAVLSPLGVSPAFSVTTIPK